MKSPNLKRVSLAAAIFLASGPAVMAAEATGIKLPEKKGAGGQKKATPPEKGGTPAPDYLKNLRDALKKSEQPATAPVTQTQQSPATAPVEGKVIRDDQKASAPVSVPVAVIKELKPIKVENISSVKDKKIEIEEPVQTMVPISARDSSPSDVTEEPYISFEETDISKKGKSR